MCHIYFHFIIDLKIIWIYYNLNIFHQDDMCDLNISLIYFINYILSICFFNSKDLSINSTKCGLSNANFFLTIISSFSPY